MLMSVSMATHDYGDDIDYAILLQAVDSITYSPGSADSLPFQSPVLLNPGIGLISMTPPPLKWYWQMLPIEAQG